MKANNKTVAKAVSALADMATCLSGNMHTLHLNYVGSQFDTMHKKVTKEYYEELDNDYDDLAEWGRCYDVFMPNKNDSAKRIEFKSLDADAVVNYESASRLIDEYFTELLKNYTTVFNAMNEVKDCAVSIGLANWLQTRIEYWAKEQSFFNKNRRP